MGCRKIVDEDQTMVAFALGSDSLYRINEQQRDGSVDQANLTADLEDGGSFASIPVDIHSREHRATPFLPKQVPPHQSPRSQKNASIL